MGSDIVYDSYVSYGVSRYDVSLIYLLIGVSGSTLPRITKLVADNYMTKVNPAS